jgi:hypothetical protein
MISGADKLQADFFLSTTEKRALVLSVMYLGLPDNVQGRGISGGQLR